MVEDKTFDDADFEETQSDNLNFTEDDIIQGSTNESIRESNILDTIFSPEELLYNLEKTMRGYQKENGEWVYKNKPLARSQFISKMVNSLRSIINSQNIASRKEIDAINIILLEKAKEFTFLVFDEESIVEEDTESVLNLHDHALEMFMGIVEGGMGNSTLRQMSANLYVKDDTNVSQNGIGLGWDGKNLIKFGGSLK